MINVTQSKPKLEFNLQERFFSTPSLYLSETLKTTPISSETWGDWFQNWLESSLSQLPKAENYELSLILSDDQEIKGFNHQYRQKNQATDVLAFATLETDFPSIPAEYAIEPVYLGDIIISVETAGRQAQQQGHSLNTELAWLAAHGFLHLLGWDHPDEKSLLTMLTQQKILLENIGLEINLI